mgnify:CR=1 FL=1|jgi:hypothetical protein
MRNASLGAISHHGAGNLREAGRVFYTLSIFGIAFATSVHSQSAYAAPREAVDPQFCNQRNITEVAANLTRDWGERYRQKEVEQVVAVGWNAQGKVLQATSSEVICNISFTNITTSSYPVRRLALRDLTFRFSAINGQSQLTPVSLPMSGLDQRMSILAVWEKLFVDDKSYRAMLEERAEQDPSLAAALGEIIGRPKGTENATWEPDRFCSAIGPNNVSSVIIDWAETTKQVRDTGLTAAETPTWLPATGWSVSSLKAVSSIPFQSVICSANVAYTANTFDGRHIPMEIRGMSYKIWGNDDGSQIYVATHNWPDEKTSEIADNAFNRAWVVNGRTFEQDWAAKRQAAAGQPKNVIEALAQAQGAYNAQVEAYLRQQGLPIDQMRAAEAEQTRQYAAPCRRNGGTWGYPTRNGVVTGQLGCYYPTGER